jgi:hypothetical protein
MVLLLVEAIGNLSFFIDTIYNYMEQEKIEEK